MAQPPSGKKTSFSTSSTVSMLNRSINEKCSHIPIPPEFVPLLLTLPLSVPGCLHLFQVALSLLLWRVRGTFVQHIYEVTLLSVGGLRDHAQQSRPFLTKGGVPRRSGMEKTGTFPTTYNVLSLKNIPILSLRGVSTGRYDMAIL